MLVAATIEAAVGRRLKGIMRREHAESMNETAVKLMERGQGAARLKIRYSQTVEAHVHAARTRMDRERQTLNGTVPKERMQSANSETNPTVNKDTRPLPHRFSFLPGQITATSHLLASGATSNGISGVPLKAVIV